MWTVKFQMFKLDLEKAEESDIKLPTSAGWLRKQDNSRKTSLLLYWLCQSLWLWITTDCGKFFKAWEFQTTLLVRNLYASWEIYMQVKKQQLELDMEQQTGFK